jgi:hypothetical protein
VFNLSLDPDFFHTRLHASASAAYLHKDYVTDGVPKGKPHNGSRLP